MKQKDVKNAKLAAAALLALVGILVFAEVIDVEGRMFAVVEFYTAFEPTVVSWNFPGTSTNPTIIRAGNFVPEVIVKMDPDTQVDMSASTGQVDSTNWAVYWDFKNDPGKVYLGKIVTAIGQTHYIKITIVFKRISETKTYTKTVEGYVKGGDVKGTWYLNQYDLSALGQYGVLRIPLSGSVTLKFVASEGASFVDSATFKIWKHRAGVPVENYEAYVATPDWTVALTKASDTTWIGLWTPQAGTYVMYGYVNIGGSNYRQLSVVPTLDGGTFGMNQWIGLICWALAAFTAWMTLKK